MLTGSLRRRAISAAALVLTGALALSACGEKESGAGDAITPAGGPDARLAGLVPDAVKSDGKIVIGVDATYAPNEFLDTDGKTVIGWERELFDAVAAKLGLKTEWVPSKFDDIVPGVQSGKYEVGVSSFTINDDRKKAVAMISYFNAGTQWATKKGNPAGIDPDDACGKSIAVQKGTVQADEDLPARQKKCKDAGKPEIKVSPYQGQDQATNAVVSGKEDAMLADSPITAYAVKETGDQLATLGSIYDAAPYGFILGKDQAKFAEAVQGATKALLDDGTYKKVLEKWNVQAGAITDPAVNP
ncbi:ABC transporter substrate-binding protein [Actinomadura flavalba]|uniref:ABC transporter substrate-binding protein n=1 Tax=Actinomadura flavalba TaxID=1120938 RepID=UPI00037D92F4|nr:ABC transporter substrate-binding protein [Actinomadura flavalba]